MRVCSLIMSTCPICFDSLESKVVSCTEVCDHRFCFPCLEKWAKVGSYCPVDRKRFKKIIKFSENSADIKQVKPRKRKKGRVRYDITSYCEICKNTNNEATLLLCDSCDLAYHCHCLTPALDKVPAGTWSCPPCVAVEEKLKKRKGLDKKGEASCYLEELKENKTHNSYPRRKLNGRSRNCEASSSFVEENERENQEHVESVLNFSTSEIHSNKTLNNEPLIPKKQEENSSCFITKSIDTNHSVDACNKVKVVIEKLDFPVHLLPSASSNSEHLNQKAYSSTNAFPEDNCCSTANCNTIPNIAQSEEINICCDQVVEQANKPVNFSVFEKLETTINSRTKYLGINSSKNMFNNYNKDKLCGICKCFKIKQRKDKLAKSIVNKKEKLKCILESNAKFDNSDSVLNEFRKNTVGSKDMLSLIKEIRSIQKEKWKLDKSFEIKKNHCIKKLTKKFRKADVDFNWSCRASKNHSLTNSLSSSKESIKNGKSETEIQRGSLNAFQHSFMFEENQRNSTSDSQLSNSSSDQLPTFFHLDDLKYLVILSDGSLYLDKPLLM